MAVPTMSQGVPRTAGSSSSHPTERVALARLWWTGPLTAAVAAFVSVVVRSIGVAAGAIPATYQPLLPPMVIGSSVVAALGATILLAILNVVTRRPIPTFRIVAGVLLIVSFSAPLEAGMGLMQGGVASPPTVAMMIVMHIIAATVIVGLLSTLGHRSATPLKPEQG